MYRIQWKWIHIIFNIMWYNISGYMGTVDSTMCIQKIKMSTSIIAT